MYKITVKELQHRLQDEYPNAYPWSDKYNMPNYLLWMLREISRMPENSHKASRWIGWVLARADIMSIEESRDLIRQDVDGE